MADGAKPEPSRADPALDAFLDRPRRGPLARYGRRLAIGVVLFVAALALGRCLKGPPRPEFLTEPVRRGDVAVTVVATGNIAPTNQVDVGSEISGIVRVVKADVNDRVEKGVVLAVIDTARLEDQAARSRAALAASRAAVEQARATLVEQQAQLARFREVSRASDGRVPSKAEMAAQEAATARARATLASAEANVEAARAELSADETQVSRAVIRSPVAGVVLKRSVEPGQTVQAAFNTPSLFIIAEDLRAMKLEVAVDEADVARVREGMPATFSVDAWPGRAFPATVTRVSLGAKSLSANAEAANASTVVSYVATLALRNEDGALRPGMTATATVRSETARNVLVVPSAALRFSPPAPPGPRPGLSIRPPDAGPAAKRERGIGIGSRQTVYVVERDRLRQVSVAVGVSDGQNVAVEGDGLAENQRVATGLKARPRG